MTAATKWNDQHSKAFICVDKDPESIPGSDAHSHTCSHTPSRGKLQWSSLSTLQCWERADMCNLLLLVTAEALLNIAVVLILYVVKIHAYIVSYAVLILLSEKM